MKEIPATAFSIYGIAQLAKQAFELTFTPRNILSAFRSTRICPLNSDIFTDDDFAPSAIIDHEPLASTTDLNSSRVELEEESLSRKDLDDLNDECENVASDYCPKTDFREVLATACPANKDVGSCNSFAAAPICKEVETPKLRFCNMADKSSW